MRASDFAELIELSCPKVLEVMYFASVEDLRHSVSGTVSEPSAEELAFSLGFVGDVMGSFGVRMQLDVARVLASNFLGEDEADLVDGDLAEVVGELANMLCGSVVSGMKSKSHFVLTHPEPFRRLPDEGGDLLVTELVTDGGVITTWMTVEGATCQA